MFTPNLDFKYHLNYSNNINLPVKEKYKVDLLNVYDKKLWLKSPTQVP